MVFYFWKKSMICDFYNFLCSIKIINKLTICGEKVPISLCGNNCLYCIYFLPKLFFYLVFHHFFKSHWVNYIFSLYNPDFQTYAIELYKENSNKFLLYFIEKIYFLAHFLFLSFIFEYPLIFPLLFLICFISIFKYIDPQTF